MRPPFSGQLPDFLVEAAVAQALAEDLRTAGDLTTDATVPAAATSSGRIVAREAGTVAGLALARAAFRALDPGARFEMLVRDGGTVTAGDRIAHASGRTRALLTGERTALNFLGHLSGIATATQRFVDAVAGTAARICCTRKTTPGLRALEKYAVRAGGGINHRFGLHDGILIKDNHIVAAGGVTSAVERARAQAGHMVRIELEVDTLEQLDEALRLPIDAVLLDNMDTDTLACAVVRVGGRVVTEASGTVSLETVRAIAETGVDLISVGAITHSAPRLDVSLEL